MDWFHFNPELRRILIIIRMGLGKLRKQEKISVEKFSDHLLCDFYV